MKIKQNRVAIIFALLLALIYAYIGWTDTFYRMGIFLVPIVLALAAALAILLTYLKKRWRNLWFPFFTWLSGILFLALIVAHVIENYKPTFVIRIPADFEGMVYLFPAKESAEELLVDENGMGYYNPGREIELKIWHGEENSTNAMNQYGRGTLVFDLADSIHREVIEFTCFEVEKGRVYGSSPWNQPHAKCMEMEEFLRLIEAGIIDTTQIFKKKFPIISN